VKTVRKALERAAKSLKTHSAAFAEVQAAIVRMEVIEASNDAMARCLVELRAFVDYCEQLPGRAHSPGFDSRVKRARAALDQLTGDKA
jgi:acyl-CoA reductase-like NAD-dependent aldehyde dehydrogenase